MIVVEPDQMLIELESVLVMLLKTVLVSVMALLKLMSAVIVMVLV